MKNIILTVATAVCTNIGIAQTIQVFEQKSTFSTGEQNALVTIIYQNSKDEVVDKWKGYLKDYKHEKVKFDNDEMFGDNILIKEWGNNPVDTYTRFEENKADNTVKMRVAFDMGGAYLSSVADAVKYSVAEKLVKDFAIKTTRNPIEEKLKKAEKNLEDLESDHKNLEKQNKDLHRDIEDYKNKIAKAEEDSKKNEDNQVKKKGEIEAQKSVIDHIKRDLESVK